MKSPHTKNTLLKKRTSQHYKQFFLREYFFSHPRRNSIFFSPTLRCFNFFATAQQPTTDNLLDNLLQNLTGQHDLTMTTEARTGNSGFKKLAVKWLNQVQFSNQTFVLIDSFVLRNRQLLKPAKRYGQVQNRLKVSKLARESPFPYLTVLYH